jgi:hypothetical protein
MCVIFVLKHNLNDCVVGAELWVTDNYRVSNPKCSTKRSEKLCHKRTLHLCCCSSACWHVLFFHGSSSRCCAAALRRQQRPCYHYIVGLCWCLVPTMHPALSCYWSDQCDGQLGPLKMLSATGLLLHSCCCCVLHVHVDKTMLHYHTAAPVGLWGARALLLWHPALL